MRSFGIGDLGGVLCLGGTAQLLHPSVLQLGRSPGL
jgi:hypothetical protein